MKLTRLLVIIILLGICGYGWYSFTSTEASEMKQKAQTLTQAENYENNQLYQLAADTYLKAIDQGQGTDAYEGYYRSCRSFYEEDPDSARQYMNNAFETMTKRYPHEASYWEAYIQYCLDREDYNKAGEVAEDAENAGASSDTLSQQEHTIRYLITESSMIYPEISLLPFDGYYRIRRDQEYGTIDESGNASVSQLYTALGEIGEDGKVLCTTEDGNTKLIDEGEVTYQKYDFTFEKAGGYGNGMLPVQNEDGTWRYVNDEGKVVADGLLTAGMFQNGVAFVQKEDGKFCLMNTDGAFSSTTYEDVRLQENGAYLFGNKTLLKNGGKWQICDGGGNPVSDFSCDDIDIYKGQPIAFCKDGKWGFVNADGTVYIEPHYEQARSFSGGVAAVKVDGTWGFIDPSDNLVIENQYEDAGYFNSEGYCVVKDIDAAGYKLIKWMVERQ